MRFTFCFSRSWSPYPIILALRSRPCCPGGKFLFSIAHDGLKQRSPFRNNFIASLRQSLHTGPIYLAKVISYAIKLVFSWEGGNHYAELASHLGSRALPIRQFAALELQNRAPIPAP